MGSAKLTVGLPDLVLASDRDESEGGVVICVEAQVESDRAKRYAIPFYQGALAYQHRLPTWVVFVSYSAAMSRALMRWSSGPPPRPEVLLLDADCVDVPELEVARIRPTAAVLAATLHGCRGDLDAARVGIAACRGLAKAEELAYIRTILAALPERWRSVIEEELTMEEYDPLWEIERKSSPYVYGVREGIEQGRKQGQREILVELILALLEVRGVALDESQRSHIATCEAVETLRLWAERAREVDSAAALFEPAPGG